MSLSTQKAQQSFLNAMNGDLSAAIADITLLEKRVEALESPTKKANFELIRGFRADGSFVGDDYWYIVLDDQEVLSGSFDDHGSAGYEMFEKFVEILNKYAR